MGQLETNFLIFIGFLVVCLVIQRWIGVKKAVGYKCMQHAFGPHKNGCILVNEEPDVSKGIFPTVKACQMACGGGEVLGKFGFKCFQDAEGIHGCMKVDEAPNMEKGIFSTAEECTYACHKGEEKKSGFVCAGPAGCLPVALAPNPEKHIFATAEECAYACHKNPEPTPEPAPEPEPKPTGVFGYKCMKDVMGPNTRMCIRVSEAPNKEQGIYSDAVDCIAACKQ